ncbi:MAG TPA: hypothetical protein VK504_12760 [Vicinamibacterales bacterium]|jgi:hypothetical protein|nr:hypothetical protein [Vicinamibacterales bacterium]
MKSVVAPLVVAVVLALAGTGFWLAGQTETRLADAHKRLATLQYSEAAAASDEVEQSIGLERRLPVVGPQSDLEVRDLRAEARYWRTDYAALAPQRDAAGSLTETNPALQLVSANAAFRTTQQADNRLDAVRRLDTVVKTYADVLRNGGGQVDAAYNYELAVRARDALAKPRAAAPKAAPKPQATVGEADLPEGPTLHGKPGGPPPAVNMNQFKIVIPKRGEERNDAPDAGKGGTKIRKG